ncbi:NAD-dependent epimerase/dehydratase family protein [Variovorax beijingensis]|uniref:NAD-dependent epimerase/dehydratase family protein n=1 Tax=Variovorax beijingensis TaxID=2496117 RepID=A0ABY0A1L7_9BURK|nr:NmrA family NAD(P)-binding protein [Variovorax beijingensis]RSZ31043.1 NAD-dependent epimerase/dehydratase family protein [Variovorax beijingensis]
MFAITGITGQVGGAVARALMEAGKDVRAVVRDAGKGAAWKQRGCEVAIASLDDAEALKRAFAGAEGVFFVLPPVFDPSPGFAEARRVIAAVREALGQTLPGKLVSLSTVGAQSPRPNLLQQHSLQETSLGTLPLPVTFLRAAWFMENAAWDVEPARTTGVIPSFLYPLDKPVPMVATADVGHLAAELLQESWQGKRIVELEGECLTPNEIALGFARVLGHDVRMEAVPRANWEALFRAQGMRNPLPRIQMLDGFNEGWIEFENPNKVRKGTVPLDAVLRELVARPLS